MHVLMKRCRIFASKWLANRAVGLRFITGSFPTIAGAGRSRDFFNAISNAMRHLSVLKRRPEHTSLPAVIGE
jgi:hypothetical protein